MTGSRECDDAGAGSLLAVAIVAAVVAVTLLVVPLGALLAVKQRASAAADAAALAAADVAVGIRSGSPCTEAAVLAEANGAALGSCELEGVIVTVRVAAELGHLRVEAAATAGPPVVTPTGGGG